MIVDIVDTVVCSSIHAPIIPNVQLFVNMLIASRKAAPFILPHKGVGFQGQRSINGTAFFSKEGAGLAVKHPFSVNILQVACFKILLG
jgi:hypothetical protein